MMVMAMTFGFALLGKPAPLWRPTECSHFPRCLERRGITCTKSVAMVAITVHFVGTCAKERSDLFILKLVDLWTYAVLEFKKKGKVCSRCPC